MGIKIVSAGKALPSYSMSNEQMSAFLDTDDEWIYSRTGIKSRYICREETCVSLACRAADRALQNAGVKPEDIGAVIVATTTNDYAFPSVACMIQADLGLPEETIAFDISAACSGFIFALGTAYGYLKNNDLKYALVVGAEKLSRILDHTDRSTCVLFGDGAGAVVISKDDHKHVHKSWSRGNREALNCKGVGTDGARLNMNGRDVFRFATSALRQAIDETLKADGEDISMIDAIVCHQANARIIENVMKKYPGMESRFFINIEQYGNTSSASIPIAIEEMMQSKRITAGMKLLCVGFGAGLTWSGLIVRT